MRNQACDFKCQICDFTFQKRDGTYYIEAAHIIPLKDGGTDAPENIVILCPNHHKMLDEGDEKARHSVLAGLRK